MPKGIVYIILNIPRYGRYVFIGVIKSEFNKKFYFEETQNENTVKTS